MITPVMIETILAREVWYFFPIAPGRSQVRNNTFWQQ